MFLNAAAKFDICDIFVEVTNTNIYFSKILGKAQIVFINARETFERIGENWFLRNVPPLIYAK